MPLKQHRKRMYPILVLLPLAGHSYKISPQHVTFTSSKQHARMNLKPIERINDSVHSRVTNHLCVGIARAIIFYHIHFLQVTFTMNSSRFYHLVIPIESLIGRAEKESVTFHKVIEVMPHSIGNVAPRVSTHTVE